MTAVSDWSVALFLILRHLDAPFTFAASVLNTLRSARKAQLHGPVTRHYTNDTWRQWVAVRVAMSPLRWLSPCTYRLSGPRVIAAECSARFQLGSTQIHGRGTDLRARGDQFKVKMKTSLRDRSRLDEIKALQSAQVEWEKLLSCSGAIPLDLFTHRAFVYFWREEGEKIARITVDISPHDSSKYLEKIALVPGICAYWDSGVASGWIANKLMLLPKWIPMSLRLGDWVMEE